MTLGRRGPTWIPSTDGVEVAVHDLGGPLDPGAPVVLFSHATGFHGRVWEPMADALTSRYRCYAIDYRGHGVSRTPAGTSFAWSGMGDDAFAVLGSDLIGPGRVVHGVAHSMGGSALILAAARRRGAFRSLWLYEATIARPGTGRLSSQANPMVAAAGRRRRSFPSYEAAVANFASKPPLDQLYPDALRAYVAGGFAPEEDGSVTLRCAPETEAAVYAAASGNGVWAVWPTLDLPVAVVAGRHDDNGPVRFMPEAAEALASATLFRHDRLGHFGPLEDPAAMAREASAWMTAHSDPRAG